MKTNVKYGSFAGFLRSKREAKYRSAREFCARVKVQVSYPQYSRYEAGEQLPSLSQALTLADALGVDTLEMALEWNLAQIEGSGQKAVREQIQGLLQTIRTGHLPAPSTSTAASSIPLDDVIVFNRSHRDLFLKDPAYRDVFTFVNAFGAFEKITFEQIAKALDLPLKKISALVEHLTALGVVLREDGAVRAAKRNLYFPDDTDFFELRQRNIRHDLDKILGRITHADLFEKRAMRTLLTRELTASQAGWVMGQLESLLGNIMDLPEDPQARSIYSVCTVVGERFSR